MRSNYGDINIGKLDKKEVRDIFTFMQKMDARGIHVFLKIDNRDRYYLSLPIRIQDEHIFADARITDKSFDYDDLSVPSFMSCIQFREGVFKSSRFMMNYKLEKRFDFFKMDDCVASNYVFPHELYLIYAPDSYLFDEDEQIIRTKAYIWPIIKEA